jgi:hypothetical protein
VNPHTNIFGYGREFVDENKNEIFEKTIPTIRILVWG